MWTRWMAAGAMLAASVTGCSSRVDSPPDEPSDAPTQVSENGESSESLFKKIAPVDIQDMRPPVVADKGLRRVESEPAAAPAEVTRPAPQPMPASIVSTTPPVKLPTDPASKADADDKSPFAFDDDTGRRRRKPMSPRGGAPTVVSPPPRSPFFDVIPTEAGAGLGGSAGGAGFGEDSIPLPEFGADDFAVADGFFSDFPTGGPPDAYDPSYVPPPGFFDGFEGFGDELAGALDDFGRPSMPDFPDFPGFPDGLPTGPVDGGLSPAPPVPPPDF